MDNDKERQIERIERRVWAHSAVRSISIAAPLCRSALFSVVFFLTQDADAAAAAAHLVCKRSAFLSRYECILYLPLTCQLADCLAALLPAWQI